MPALSAFEDEQYLKPILENDPLLQYDYEPDSFSDNEADHDHQCTHATALDHDEPAVITKGELRSLMARLYATESVANQMRTAFQTYRETAEQRYEAQSYVSFVLAGPMIVLSRLPSIVCSLVSPNIILWLDVYFAVVSVCLFVFCCIALYLLLPHGRHVCPFQFDF